MSPVIINPIVAKCVKKGILEDDIIVILLLIASFKK